VETVQVARADGVVTVTLDRPERKNAVNDAMWRELLATFTEVAAKELAFFADVISAKEALEDEARCETVSFGTADTAEAMAAFLQKREPRFTGS
jgi:enoyl-CoA hydratase/carnithine racemase